jgi:hypothetical protein
MMRMTIKVRELSVFPRDTMFGRLYHGISSLALKGLRVSSSQRVLQDACAQCVE